MTEPRNTSMEESVLELEIAAGTYIGIAAERACRMAKERGGPVKFVFNELPLIALPGDNAEQLVEEWIEDYHAKRVARGR